MIDETPFRVAVFYAVYFSLGLALVIATMRLLNGAMGCLP